MGNNVFKNLSDGHSIITKNLGKLFSLEVICLKPSSQSLQGLFCPVFD